MNEKVTALRNKIREAFPATAPATTTLEEANAIDEYAASLADFENQTKDIDWRTINSSYLEKFFWGITHLDERSWTAYLPAILDYSVTHLNLGTGMPTDYFLSGLRSTHAAHKWYFNLSDNLRGVVDSVLEFLAIEPESHFAERALGAIQDIDDYRREKLDG